MVFARWWIGVVLAVIAAFVSNLGLNLQKLSHLRQRKSIEQSINQSNNQTNNQTNHERSPFLHADTHNYASPTNFSVDSIRIDDQSIKVSPLLSQTTSPLLLNHSLLTNGQSNYQSFDQAGLPIAQPFRRTLSHNNQPNNQPQSAYRSINQTQSVYHSLRPYFHEPLWQIGLSLTFFGSLLDFLALIFAGTTVIAPLASLTLVSNTFLADWLIGEKVRLVDCLITCLIVFGSSLSVACADHSDRPIERLIDLFDLFLQPRFLVYQVIVVCTMAGLYLNIAHCEHMQQSNNQSNNQSNDQSNNQSLNQSNNQSVSTLQKMHRFSYAALSGLIGGQSVLFAKVTGQMLVKSLTSTQNFLLYPTSYVVLLLLGFSVTAQLHWLNEGLKHFTSLYIVPTFQAFWMISSIFTGMIFFQEYRGVFLGWSSLGFPVGVMITITGVYLLSQKEDADERIINESINQSIDQTDNRLFEQTKRRSYSFDSLVRSNQSNNLSINLLTSFPSASSSSFLALPTFNQSMNIPTNQSINQSTNQSISSNNSSGNLLSSSMPNQMYYQDDVKM